MFRRVNTRAVALAAAALALLLTACQDETPSGAGGDLADVGRGRDTGRMDDGAAGDDSSPDDDTAAADTTADDTAGSDGTVDTSGDVGNPSRDGQLVPDPDVIYFSVEGAGTVQEQVVRVYNQTDVAVRFESVEIVTSASGFSLVEPPVNEVRHPGQAVGFGLRYEAPNDADATGELLVHNSWGDPVVIPIVVASKVSGGSCIRVVPTGLTFGPIVRGTGTETKPFTIENCGTTDVNVLRLDRGRVFGFLPTPENFQWTSPRPLPFTLASEESVEVQVTYEPGRAGTDQGAVEVVSNVDGSERIRVSLTGTTQVPPLEELDVHLQLNWDVTGGSDVDFHFYPESSELFSCDDCYYSNMSPDWGVPDDIIDDPFLDRDDLEGPGPENINVDELPDGTYIIAVHYYSDTGSSGSGDDSFPSSTNATVDVYIGGTLVATYGPEYLDQTDRTWYVARLEWPSAALTELGDTEIIDRGDYTWCSGGIFGR